MNLDSFSNGELHSVIIKYLEGYVRGRNWPDMFENGRTPGGPRVYTPSSYAPSKEDLHESKLSRLCNEAWRAGWEYGHNEKHTKPLINPKLSDDFIRILK